MASLPVPSPTSPTRPESPLLVPSKTSPYDLPLVCLLKAINFAAIKHRRQTRKDSDRTPYINHPIGVAHILAVDGGVLDVGVLEAAVLHDTIEDTDTTEQELREHFGDRVTGIVLECTDDKTIRWEDRKQRQIDSAPHKSIEARQLKLADKLYNLRDLCRQVPVGWTSQRVQGYFVWAKKVTDGCRGANEALERQLDELYRSGTFTFEGKQYKSHPDYA
ncbi:hypothetical protein RI367_000555 [Sorochytrium milnesiophthora]